MDGHNLVAVYVSRPDAERVQDRLIAFGIPASDIRLSSASVASGAVGAVSERSLAREPQHSFWDWLFGSDYQNTIALGTRRTCAKAEPCSLS
jgi:hypothetical protein